MQNSNGVLTVRELLRVLIEAPPDLEVWVRVNGENVALSMAVAEATHCGSRYTQLTAAE